jgi:hypothetical protein
MKVYGHRGQTVTEAALVLPTFLVLIFAILQACHVGLALAIVNYGASSVARQAVQFNTENLSSGQDKFKSLMAVGLEPLPLQGGLENSDGVTADIHVTACAKLQAYPFVGEILDKSLKASGKGPCGGTKSLGPIFIEGPAPYHFIILGQAKARMNYVR